MNRVRPLIKASLLGLAAGLTLLGGVSAQTPDKVGADAVPGSNGIFTGLLAGRDMAAQVALLSVDKAEREPQADPERYRGDALIASQQATLARAAGQAARLARMPDPWLKTQATDDLLATLNQLQGRQMLLEQRAREALLRVQKLEQAEAVAVRAAAALDGFTTRYNLVEGHIATLQALLAPDVDSREKQIQWRAQLQSVTQGLQQMVTQESASTPAPILRALPFDRPLLSPGALQTSPTITPSYAQADPEAGGSFDLAASTGAPLNDAILAKAAELGNDYVAIYEFVRSQIRTEYYSGAMKGAEATLRSGAGNDIDQASLLIALYRASNVPARYVHGVARLAIDQVGAPLGLTDANQVLVALSRAGIAHEPVIQGGQIGAVDMAYTWVSIFVPYANYRGVPVDLAGKLWLPLAPAIKTHSFAPGSNIALASGLDGTALVDAYLADRVIDPPLTEARNQVEAYLAANPGLGSYAEQLPQVAVAAQTMKLLPAALPFEVMAVTAETAALEPGRQQSLRLLLTSSTGTVVMDETVPVSALLDRRVTLSYAPATIGDFNVIREFGGRTGVPAYLVRLRPQLKANGKVVAAAAGDLGMGNSHELTLELSGPAGTRTTDATLIAGSYAALNLSAQLGLPEPVDDATALADDSEGRAARLLYNQAARYAHQWDEAEGELAGLFDVAVIRPLPALALVTTSVHVEQTQGLNDSLTFRGANLDAALRSVEPVSRGADALAETHWMRLAALQGSVLESTIFETQWAVESISADKGLRLAVRQTLPIAEVDATNAATVLPGLSHASHVIDAVQSAVDQGYQVLIPETEITLNAWTGSTWHAWDPDLGSSGYFISGGLAGGSTTEPPEDWVLDALANVLANPYGGEPNDNPDEAALIRIIPASDGQFGKAGDQLERPLAVLVTDADGRPVSSAMVRFEVRLGGDAQLSDGIMSGSSIEVQSDVGGVARVPVTLGEKTDLNPVYIRLESGDEEPNQVAENWVDASVVFSDSTTLEVGRPFIFYTGPNDPAELTPISGGLSSYPNGWVGPVLIRLEDEFGNPVANREIRYNAGAAVANCASYNSGTPARFFQGDDCTVPFVPGSSSCGTSSLTVTSTLFGPYVQVINGDGPGGTRFPVRVSSDGVPDFTFETNAFGGLSSGPTVSEIVTLGAFGNVIDSAPPGETAPAPRFALTFTVERTGEDDCLFDFGPGEGTVAWDVEGAGRAGADPIGPNYYRGFLPVGNSPDIYTTRIELNGVDLGDGPEDLSFFANRMAAVLAEVTSVNPVPIGLNLSSRSVDPIEVNYRIAPEEFPISLQVNLLEDGNVIDFKYLRQAEHVSSVTFAGGKLLDVRRDYTVQLLVNPGTPFEITSEPFPVELTLPIVRSVRNASGGGGGPVIGDMVFGRLSFFNEIDIPNERLCRRANIEIELTQAARVSMSFERLDVSGEPTGQMVEVLSNELLAAGINPVDVSADDLGTDIYNWRIDAVSELDGSTDDVTGTASSSYIQKNSLPVGHPIVKGVDMATGKMVLSRQDINVPGLGANLEFVRSYASGARGANGPVGSGWSHNYQSTVQLSQCGDYVVSGAQGGSIRFVRDGGGFRPLKGYHGTLIENAADGSFDYFPKGGRRFHFFRGRDRTWHLDLIEDTNGNQTRLTHETTPDGPRLSTVTDPSGRTLSFQYESRNFRAWRGDVITAVTGPGGITLTLAYDEFGNQVSADREGGAVSETYTYMTDSHIGNANLLVAATDNVVNATIGFAYDEVTLTVPIGTFSLPVLSSTVSTISEPDGGQTQFTYTAGPWGMNGQAVARDANGNSTTYTMNEYGASTAIAAPNGTSTTTWETETDVLMMAATDENGRQSSFTYDEWGNVLTEQVGSLTRSFSYTQIGMIRNRVASSTNFRGFTTINSYDGAGNLLTSTLDGVTQAFTYDDIGNQRTSTDGNGSTTNFGYDQYGYQTSRTHPEGGMSIFTYDVRGRRRTEQDPNGNTTRFDYNDRDGITQTLYADGSALNITYGSRTRTEVDSRGASTVTTMDAKGRIISVRNALGDVVSSNYDGNGNKTSETDFAGRTTTFTYDGANRLTSISAPEGRVTSFTYDGVGNKLTETVSGPGGSRTTTFTYDPNRYFQTSVNRSGLALTSRVVDAEGNVTQETDPEGRVTTFSYDAFNRLTSSSGPLGSGRTLTYDGVGNLLSETTNNTPSNQQRRFVYDGFNRQIQSIDAEGAVSSTDYDSASNVIRTVDGRGRATDFVYNSRNRRIRVIDPEGGTTQFGYDSNGNLEQQTQANGNVLVHTYDLLNRRTSESDSIGALVSSTYDAVGNVLTQTDALGNTTTNTYDGLNRVTRTARPLGRTTDFTYNAFSEVTSETDAAGNTLAHTYDDLGRRTATTGPADLSLAFAYDLVGNLTSSTDSNSNTTTSTYNALNQQIATQDPLYSQSFTYDLVGNLLSETDRRGIVSTFRYDRENRNTEFVRAGQVIERRTYDAIGNLLFLEDANGNTTGYEYDGRNQVSRESRPQLSITTFVRNIAGDVIQENRPAGRAILSSYDARHRQTSQTNPAGEVRQFQYDLNNNRIALLEPLGTWLYEFDAANRTDAVVDPLGNRSTYEYDTRDNRTAQTDANGRRTEFTYDARNRVIEKRYPDSVVQGFEYDPNGNLTQRTDPNGTVGTFTYDALNRQIGRTLTSTFNTVDITSVFDANNNLTSVTEVDSLTGTSTVTRNFDNLDRLTLVQDRFGQTLQYSYDANGNRSLLRDHNGQQTQYTYDGLNRLISAGIPGLGTTTNQYLPNSLLQQLEYPNGATAQYEYDLADRVTRIINTQGGETVSEYRYEYDAAGNRIRQEETNGAAGLEVTTYGYDIAGRLDQVSYPDRDVSYTLDPVGNRLTETIVTASDTTNRSFTYNTRDQLLSVADAALTIDYTYDANGNNLSKTLNGELTTYDYDARNRIAVVTVGAQVPMQYEYDYQGLRVAKDVDGNRTQYLYDDQSVLAETNTLGNTLARFHYGSDRRLAESRGGQNSYFLQDALRTTTAITDQVGALLARYTYDAWGNLTRETGTSDQPFGFTGFQFDAETGLYYAKQRFYDAFTGRFLSEDPFDGDILTPPSLHRYLYALVNPTVFVDPSGQIPLFRDFLDRFTETSEILRSAADSLNTVEGNIFTRGAAKVGAGLLGALNVTVVATQGIGELANTAANGLVQASELAVTAAGGDFGEFGKAVAEENQQFSDGIQRLASLTAEEAIDIGVEAVKAGADAVVAAANGDTAAIFDVTTFVGDQLLGVKGPGPSSATLTRNRVLNNIDETRRGNASSNFASGQRRSRVEANVAATRRGNDSSNFAGSAAAGNRVAPTPQLLLPAPPARLLLPAPPAKVRLPNEAGIVREFVTEADQTFYRVFSGDRTQGAFLTSVRPSSGAFAREALALPRNNTAEFIQEVTVPAGTRLRRSRAAPMKSNEIFPDRRGGAEQFELKDRISSDNFGEGVPLDDLP